MVQGSKRSGVLQWQQEKKMLWYAISANIRRYYFKTNSNSFSKLGQEHLYSITPQIRLLFSHAYGLIDDTKCWTFVVHKSCIAYRLLIGTVPQHRAFQSMYIQKPFTAKMEL